MSSRSASTLLRTVVATAVALVAFAGNSLLCRLALREQAIDPFAFTALRLLAGALVLFPLLPRTERFQPFRERAWLGGVALFVYALAFSAAYVTLDAGVGALLLFGAVQVTMIAAGFFAGERLRGRQWLGALAAIAGLVVLVLPLESGERTRDTLLMLLAGGAWGAYSLYGRKVSVARTATARTFVLTVPAALVLLAWTVPDATFTTRGAVLAMLSGSVTSGLGYLVWYVALRGHSATSAGLVQLSVPVLAALAGVLLLDESWTERASVAAVLTLGGIALATTGGRRR